MQRGHASRPTVRLGEVHMPLQGQALKTVARPWADEHPASHSPAFSILMHFQRWFAASRPRWLHRHNCKAASSSTNPAAMVTGNRCFVAFLIRRQAAGQPPCAPAACAARPWQQTPNWQPSRAPTARAAAFQHWGHYDACTSANERFERLQMRRDACTAAPPQRGCGGAGNRLIKRNRGFCCTHELFALLRPPFLRSCGV